MKGHTKLRSILAFVLIMCMLLPMAMTGVTAVAEAPNFTDQSSIFALYSGGTASNIMEYDCGNAVANNGSKSYLRIIQDTTETEYLNYCRALSSSGFSSFLSSTA